MSPSRREFLQTGAVAAAGLMLPRVAGPFGRTERVADFEPTWASLAQYRTPDWFRDAKFGMWAHWGPQCVPEQGDWYGRQMYIPGHRQYIAHAARYGHPSRVGFKDVINRWRAEEWRPDELVALYQQAGAQYFMALANHHDNLDLWDSRHQPWNSVRVGPKKNIIAGWERAARRAGLRFGVSVHAAHAWSWYEPAQGADKSGPQAGVPYDGALTRAQGKGQWWDGLDPQDLYEQRHTPGKELVWDWDAARGSSIPDRAYCERFYARTVDLIDKYDPDMVYFDDTALPLHPISDVGLRLAAYYYNRSMKRHGGRLEGVITGKVLTEEQRKCMVWDIERGVANEIVPLPFQTDTCIGDWHYSRPLFARHGYKSPTMVAQMLVDIVSKNGNLMLNVPLPGSGAPDDDALGFLSDFTRWMGVNGGAIFGSRPWAVYGEGPSTQSTTALREQGFNEGRNKPYTGEDLRFVQKDGKLYAFALAWPESKRLTIKSLATGSPHAPGQIQRVELLGAKAPLEYTRDAQGLHVTLPEGRSSGWQFTFDYVFTFEISGQGLTKG
ncbi:MAG TPA: alpha-L-fucosidase [Gemmatimonadaceae bacterium]|nr:alpha-L-fucosidase [Gemmatimonadaceae bacterium]